MKREKIVKMILIFSIIIISFLLYTPLLNEKPLESGKFECCNLTINSEGIFDKSTPLNTLRKITSPFDLKYYRLYLEFNLKEDPSCYPAYPDILIYQLENKTENLTRGNSKFIKQIKINEPYEIVLLNFTYSLNEDYLSGRNSIASKTKAVHYKFTVGEEVNYFLVAKMNWWDAIGNMFIFSIFWIGIILIIKEITNWINEQEKKK